MRGWRDAQRLMPRVDRGLVTGLVLTLSTGFAQEAADDRLRLHYDFESVADGVVQDVSGHGHDGVLEPKASQRPVAIDTPYGRALKLEKGKGHGVRVAFAEDLGGVEGLTVLAWIRPDVARSHLAVVANKGDRVKGRPARGYRLSVFWNRLFMDVGFGGDNGVRLLSDEWSIQAGYWVHVGMTFDGRHTVVYINASEAARQTLSAPASLTLRRQAFTIGKFFWNDAYPFVGLIGDVRIYSSALSGDEVFEAANVFLEGRYQ